jgi:hypothetical protein
MKHARADYDVIQDGGLGIPADEPVFLIRGQDAVAGDAVRAWADLAEAQGAAPDILAIAREHAAKMDRWPKKKVADLPPRPEVDDLLRQARARFDATPPEQQREHREAQRRSYVRGEMMLEHPEMTAEEANALIDRAGRP